MNKLNWKITPNFAFYLTCTRIHLNDILNIVSMFENIIVLFKGEYLKTVHFILSSSAANSFT